MNINWCFAKPNFRKWWELQFTQRKKAKKKYYTLMKAEKNHRRILVLDLHEAALIILNTKFHPQLLLIKKDVLLC